MKKYMTMDRFYDLAVREGACYLGLKYLELWIKNNPNKKHVNSFFRDHIRIKKSHINIFNDVLSRNCNYDYSDNKIKYSQLEGVIRSYFKWIAIVLINWNKIRGSSNIIIHIHWLKKYYNYDYNFTGNKRDCDKNNSILISFLLTSYEGEE